MAKLFKNSKQVFSFVIAFAIIAVSLFTGVAINADAACGTTNVDYWDGTEVAPTTVVQGVTIIENAEQLAYLVKTGAAKGSKYKVADNIDAFIMQPQNSVAATKDADGNGVADILEFDGYSDVKAYFEDATLTDKKSWYTSKNSATFSGEFDGNGIAIYGLYVKGGWESAGLFVGIANNATFKNIAIRNSYIAAGSYVGALFATCDANSSEVVTLDTIEISNCYIYNTTVDNGNNTDPRYNRTSIINGRCSNRISLSNILIYNDYAENTDGVQIEWAFKVANNWNDDVTNHKYNNMVLLGARAYEPAIYNAYRSALYTGVYTDKPVDDGKYTYKAEQLAHVDVVNAVGVAAKEAMPNLDWENTWIATSGYPELRAFHNLKEVSSSAGHGYECENCDIDAVFPHVWHDVKDECAECGYTCAHTSQTVTGSDAATCVTKQIVYSTCNECGKNITAQVGADVVGHTLVWHDEDPADCLKPGVSGYWECTVCGGNYTGTEEQAKWGAMDAASKNPTVDFATPLGSHNKGDADAEIYIQDPTTGHWYVCTVCDGHLDHDSNLLDEGEVEAHRFENSICTDCGFECKEHDYKTTGNVVVVGNCATDRVEEAECTICKAKAEIVTQKAGHNIVAVAEVKPDDKLEGTKAHYKCDACGSVFADAEGKTTATMASLVIPKTLPEGYGTTVPNNQQNADTSDKSPSTKDSLTSVLAVAALAGAAVVFARKARV